MGPSSSFVGQYSGEFFLLASIPWLVVVVLGLLAILIIFLLLRFNKIGRRGTPHSPFELSGHSSEEEFHPDSVDWRGIILYGLIWTLIFRYIYYTCDEPCSLDAEIFAALPGS